MLACTFFGHKDTPKEIEPTLRSTLIDLIENKKVLKFYVGNYGNFDRMVKRCLIELTEIYPIDCTVVLAYLPDKKRDREEEITIGTVLPDGIETVSRKFAISYCNKWMIKQSDYVITYVRHTIGGAAKFKEVSVKEKKIVINIASQSELKS